MKDEYDPDLGEWTTEGTGSGEFTFVDPARFIYKDERETICEKCGARVAWRIGHASFHAGQNRDRRVLINALHASKALP